MTETMQSETCALALYRATQVMSRQAQDPETQLARQGPKRPRQDDRLAQREAPCTLSPTISMSPFIRGFQDDKLDEQSAEV